MDDFSPPFLSLPTAHSLSSPPEASPFGGPNTLYPAFRSRGSRSLASPLPVARPGLAPSEPHSIKLETTGISSHAQLQFRRIVTQAHTQTVVRSLQLANRQDLAQKIADCGSQDIYLVCKGCRTLRVVQNHCDNHTCPRCQPKLARARYDELSFWAKAIRQPKHVVLTMRNQPWLDAGSIRSLSAAFARLRRRAFAKNWRSGLWSIEVTNEGNGWHVHLHALVDANWIDAGELARQWASILGQSFAIVKVKDAREASYLREVTKYCVKGSELATWSPSHLAEFVDAIAEARTFGTFGALYKRRSEMNAGYKALMEDRGRCECGCNDWQIYSQEEYERACCTWLPPPVREVVSDPQLPLSLFAVNSFNQPC